MLDIPTKPCTKCRRELPATREHFSPQRRGKYGLHSYCKPCASARVKAQYWVDPAKGRAEAYARRDPERLKVLAAARRQKHVAANRASIQVAASEYRRCPGCLQSKPLTSAYYQRDAGRKNGFHSRCKVCAQAVLQAWRAANPKGYRAQQVRARARRREHLIFDIRASIDTRIKRIMKGHVPSVPLEAMLGYTAEQLIVHIERQFASGMSWKNYGRWHIDHILPVSSFKFTSVADPEFRACWALSNLRPLWAKKNLTKHATRQHLL